MCYKPLAFINDYSHKMHFDSFLDLLRLISCMKESGRVVLVVCVVLEKMAMNSHTSLGSVIVACDDGVGSRVSGCVRLTSTSQHGQE